MKYRITLDIKSPLETEDGRLHIVAKREYIMVCCASCEQWFNYDSVSKFNYIVKRRGYPPRFYCGVCNTIINQNRKEFRA